MTLSILFRAIVAFVVFVASCTLARAQSPLIDTAGTSKRIDAGVVSLGNHALYWETRIEPIIPAIGELFGIAVESDTDRAVIHRLLMDRARKVYFGYDIRIEAVANKSYRLTFQTLSQSPQQAQRILGSDSAQWTLIPPPGFPSARTIREGDVLELPLLVNDAWSQRLVEYITVQQPSRAAGFQGLAMAPREFSFTGGMPRDFTLDDVELRLNAPTVTRTSRDGRVGTFQRGQVANETSGPIVWLYVPYRGRFLLSLQPRTEADFPRRPVRCAALQSGSPSEA